LFRTLEIEFGRTALGSPERTIVLASLESVRRAMAAARLSRKPSRVRRRERGRCNLGLEAVASCRGFSLVEVTRLRSSLQHDGFERFAAREMVEIGGHHTPAAVGARSA
jgi:hypothetical protein